MVQAVTRGLTAVHVATRQGAQGMVEASKELTLE